MLVGKCRVVGITRRGAGENRFGGREGAAAVASRCGVRNGREANEEKAEERAPGEVDRGEEQARGTDRRALGSSPRTVRVCQYRLGESPRLPRAFAVIGGPLEYIVVVVVVVNLLETTTVPGQP